MESGVAFFSCFVDGLNSLYATQRSLGPKEFGVVDRMPEEFGVLWRGPQKSLASLGRVA